MHYIPLPVVGREDFSQAGEEREGEQERDGLPDGLHQVGEESGQ